MPGTLLAVFGHAKPDRAIAPGLREMVFAAAAIR